MSKQDPAPKYWSIRINLAIPPIHLLQSFMLLSNFASCCWLSFRMVRLFQRKARPTSILKGGGGGLEKTADGGKVNPSPACLPVFVKFSLPANSQNTEREKRRGLGWGHIRRQMQEGKYWTLLSRWWSRQSRELKRGGGNTCWSEFAFVNNWKTLDLDLTHCSLQVGPYRELHLTNVERLWKWTAVVLCLQACKTGFIFLLITAATGEGELIRSQSADQNMKPF